jgi:hypothetical protein
MTGGRRHAVSGFLKYDHIHKGSPYRGCGDMMRRGLGAVNTVKASHSHSGGTVFMSFVGNEDRKKTRHQSRKQQAQDRQMSKDRKGEETTERKQRKKERRISY